MSADAGEGSTDVQPFVPASCAGLPHLALAGSVPSRRLMKRTICLKIRPLKIAAAALLLSPMLCAQGKFTNFETPHVKPITTARVTNGTDSFDLVFVCNSADNSVEIYDAQNVNGIHQFFQRVPVGLGPATVRWNEENSSFYTCNFDGDSVSRVKMDIVGTGASAKPFGSLIVTTKVGDQPSDITFDTALGNAAITLSGRSALVVHDMNTLVLKYDDFLLTAGDPTVSLPFQPEAVGVKAPRQLQLLNGGRSFVLNFMSDFLVNAGGVDVDLWYFDPTITPAPAPAGVGGFQMGGLGSTNQAFAINSAEDTMVVVGTRAQNLVHFGESNVATAPFGFVESHMWVLDIPAGSAPVLHGDAVPSPGTSPALPNRNLNLDYSVSGGAAVTKAKALSQPSDVVLIENEQGDIQTIALTAFHSDKVTLLSPNPLVPGGYKEDQISLAVNSTPGGAYSVAGPSGIAYDSNTGLLYVTCRLDSTLRIIDPQTPTATPLTIPLQNDPTPDYIRRGRQFLYDADETSGSGFVSCASCHVNGTTDGLSWDLGTSNLLSVPAGLDGFSGGPRYTDFPTNKGFMVTQTLQGLVNYEVNTDAQYLMTNAPYHWRGDQPGFEDFNPAFVNLMQRMAQLDPSDMDDYTEFINSIVHPPNPEQPDDRIVEGSLDPNDPDDPSTATGAQLGLQIFHNFPSDGNGTVSCASCHMLPEGSDNLLTFDSAVTTPFLQPTETAALRNLIPRESVLRRDNGTARPFVRLTNFGLTHGGFTNAREQFAVNFFVEDGPFVFPGPATAEAAQIEAVTQYVREFDWGMAPTAGGAYTLDPTKPADNTYVFNLAEGQVLEANIGLAVIARTGTIYRGFYFDATQVPPSYREEGTNNFFTRAQIDALATPPGDMVMLQGTPPGNERRIAATNGIASLLTGPAPANLVLEPMAPMTYHVEIPKLTSNVGISPGLTPDPEPNTSHWALVSLQISVNSMFGISTVPHHEPPRRFRVSGDNIRHGAKLVLGIPTVKPNQTPGAPPEPVQFLVLDLLPTKYFSGDKQVWETEEELDPLMTMALLNGGPFADGVQDILDRNLQTPPVALDPTGWNYYAFGVANEDGTVNTGILYSPLTVQDVR